MLLPLGARGGVTAAEAAPNLYPSAEQRVLSPGHTTYHIDPAGGDDARSGLQPNLAWRTF